MATPEADPAEPGGGVPAGGADAFRIGEVVNGRYAVVTRISEGPSGRLYRSRDLTADAEVTLQLLLGWPPLEEEVIRRLGKDLAVTRRLAETRSDVAAVLDCGLTSDGRAFMVMEPLGGRSLAELIRWREPLSVERATRLALRIAEGLRAAHALGLVHGALGAEHVLVQPDDAVRLVGFEVARLRAACQRPSVAPRGGADGLTKAADTQAVAMMLLEMLTTGVRPGADGAAAPLEAPRGGAIPPVLKQLVMQFVVKPPGAATRDIGALVEALTADLDPRPRRPISRAWQRRARSGGLRVPWARLGAGALAFVVSVSAGWMAWSLVAAPRPPMTAGSRGVPATVGPGPSTPGGAGSPSAGSADPPVAAPVTRPASAGSADAPAMPPVARPGTPSARIADAPVAPPVVGAGSSSARSADAPTTPPIAGPAPASARSAGAPATPPAPAPTPPSRGRVAEGPGTSAPVVAGAPPATEPELASPPADSGVMAPVRVRRLRATPPIDPPPTEDIPAPAPEGAPPRARPAVRPPPRGDAPPSNAEAPDPSAIIDWLLTTRSGSPTAQPARTGARRRRNG